MVNCMKLRFLRYQNVVSSNLTWGVLNTVPSQWRWWRLKSQRKRTCSWSCCWRRRKEGMWMMLLLMSNGRLLLFWMQLIMTLSARRFFVVWMVSIWDITILWTCQENVLLVDYSQQNSQRLLTLITTIILKSFISGIGTVVGKSGISTAPIFTSKNNHSIKTTVSPKK